MHNLLSTPLRLAICVSLVALVACQHAEGPEVDEQQMTLRDLIGMEPIWLDDLDPERKRHIRARIEAEFPGAHESAWLDGWIDTETPVRALPERLAPWDQLPEDPLNSMRALDFWRQDEGRDAWISGLFVAVPEVGVQTHACPIAADALLGEGSGEAPPTWEVIGSLEPAQERALATIAPGIERWRVACLDRADLPRPICGLRVVPQPGAPFMLAYWPQRRSLYVNPALMALWVEHTPPPVARITPAAADLRVREARIEAATLEACIEELRQVCTQCDEGFALANPDSCPPIFPTSPIHTDCEALESELVDGYLKYCIHEFLKRPSVHFCFSSSTNQIQCGLPSDQGLSSVSDLGEFYDGFSNNTTRLACRDQLGACIADPVPMNNVPDEPDLAPEPWEPETLEGQCWSIGLNDTGCNDLMGKGIGFELCWYDPKRPDKRDTMCSEQQPTNCCGEQGEYPDPERAAAAQ